MDTNNEILDAIEILADKKIGENITKILTGICKSVNINNNTCIMDSNGVTSTVQFYGSPPEVNELYRIFVPSNDMSRSFIVVPPKFTVNPNLLDNWYFGRPVNQRGKSEYTGSGYTVDRWTAKEGVVSLSSSGLTLQNSTWLDQIIENLIENRIYTISLLTANGVLLAGTGLLNKDSFISVRIDGGGYIDISYHADVSGYYVELARADAAQPLSILAAKLELGPTQTLAHLENGNWVLNEIPDYGEQLRKCQRYYYQVHYTQYQTINMAYEDTAYAFLMLPLPVEMRLKYPVVTQSTPILLGTSEKTLVSAEVSGCMARLGLNYDAMTNPSRSCYSYCPNVSGVTFTFSADL